MITSSKPILIRAAGLTMVMRKSLLGLGLAIIATSLHAQSILANGQVSGVSAGAGSFDYTLTVGEGSGTTTPIASFWYAWVPGEFFLPGDPSSAAGPTGWTATIVNDGPNLSSIQFQSTAAGFDIAPGASMTFSFVASFSPAQLAAAPNSGLSVAYAGVVDASAPNGNFTVQPAPEPSELSLLLAGSIVACWVGFQRIKSCRFKF
jgi:hypothetical protein